MLNTEHNIDNDKYNDYDKYRNRNSNIDHDQQDLLLTGDIEVLIIGGSFSGMATALTLGRSLRKVIVLDEGNPCNRFAPHAHNLLGSEGIPPMELHSRARKELQLYPTIQLVKARVVEVRKKADEFIISTSSGQVYVAKKLVLATGLLDELPPIMGLWDCWGKSAIHCPYCHGYEFKGAKTGLLATSESALHLVSLLQQWTSDLRIFTYGDFQFRQASLDYLKEQQIPLIAGQLKALDHHQGYLRQIQLEAPDGKRTALPLEVLYVMPKINQSLDLTSSLAYKLTPSGHIEIDEGRHTCVKGVYAVGDNSNPFRSLSAAINSGMTAGAMINFDLVNEIRPLP